MHPGAFVNELIELNPGLYDRLADFERGAERRDKIARQTLLMKRQIPTRQSHD